MGGRPSFDIMAENIKHALNLWNVRIRVNISLENLPLIPLLIDQLSEHGLNNGSIIYFALVDSLRHESDKRCIKWAEKLMLAGDFPPHHLALIKKAVDSGFKVGLPISPLSICSAVKMGTFMIEPDGLIKRCINDLGCGSGKVALVSDMDASRSLEKGIDPWNNYDPFKNQACLSCFVLPICLGGCPWISLKGLPMESRCHYLKEQYLSYIKLLYQLSQEGVRYDPEEQILRRADI